VELGFGCWLGRGLAVASFQVGAVGNTHCLVIADNKILVSNHTSFTGIREKLTGTGHFIQDFTILLETSLELFERGIVDVNRDYLAYRHPLFPGQIDRRAPGLSV
jgi:hypothetical protein